jgi:hypothetical protein
VGDLHGTPLARLAKLLGVEGLPPEDYGWTEVIDAVGGLMRLRDEMASTADLVLSRTCCVYDHGLKAPCDRRVLVQNVCEVHATMCAMCGKRLSARGVCPTCLDDLTADRAAGNLLPSGQVLLAGQRCGLCRGQPVYTTPSGSLCPTCGGGVPVEDVPEPRGPRSGAVQPAPAPLHDPPTHGPAPRRSRRAESF